jgi:dTDP-4-amino-4,6-dideoxygalactose transaminase
VLALPIYAELADAQLQQVVAAIGDAVRQAGRS